MSHHILFYMIFDYADVTDDMVAAAQETSRETLRHSVEGQGTDRVILKYDPDHGHPPIFDGVPKYSWPDMLAILSGPDWTEEE